MKNHIPKDIHQIAFTLSNKKGELVKQSAINRDSRAGIIKLKGEIVKLTDRLLTMIQEGE